jgi:Bifunctional DNA primase/polymerase, N-terminal
MATKVFPDGCPARAVLRRLNLRRAALTYAHHGWKVAAGSRLCGNRFSCGPGCPTVSCHPLLQRWEQSATRDAAAITERWRNSPHSILLPTGDAFDVVEVPAYIGAAAGRAVHGPVAVTPLGRWMFLVRPGGRLHIDLAQHHDVVLHGPGSWIPAPPMSTPHGRVRWAVAPHEIDWQIPDIRTVQHRLLAALPRIGVPRRPLAA